MKIGAKRILTVRAVSGLSGDMLLGGLASLAGLENQELDALIAELAVPDLKNCLHLEKRSLNGVGGVGCRINLAGGNEDYSSHVHGHRHEQGEHTGDGAPERAAHGTQGYPEQRRAELDSAGSAHEHRTFTDIAGLIQSSALPDRAKDLALSAFSLLAEAEAAVHGIEKGKVAFHEVGALDSILDVCLCCRIFEILKPERFVCSPLPLADGMINCAHGILPAPAPAVLRLLEGVAVCSFAGSGETVTPTALSLLKALGADFGPWPEMIVERTVISYGSRIFPGAPNGAVWALGRGL
ncbi:MAG: LarC family nickel insertion protein [Desulfovibrio sp.]|jgi:uncharacterized protein (DUF111 family)|nr:LarC family nickel insertion protein [Desulfovibrio sp.]